jgi:NTP pyrophosphatase (non-canonical NTP hydrolase)
MADGPSDNIHILVKGAPHLRVCFMTSNGPTDANARLIAAAPDLLEVLKAIRATVYEQPVGVWFHAIDAAIKKATGKGSGSMSERIDLYELHQQMTAHLFTAYSSADERFLALALCGEAGELANMIKKRWRDGVGLEEEIRDEIADVRVYLELLAKCFGIQSEKLDERVQQKLQKVIVKHCKTNAENPSNSSVPRK